MERSSTRWLDPWHQLVRRGRSNLEGDHRHESPQRRRPERDLAGYQASIDERKGKPEISLDVGISRTDCLWDRPSTFLTDFHQSSRI